MDDKKNSRVEVGAPLPASMPALYPHPPRYSAHQFLSAPYHMYYHTPQYSQGIYSPYPPLQHTHYSPSVSVQPKPLNSKCSKPLLAKTPPLMPRPPTHVPLYPHLAPQPGWNIVYPVVYSWSPVNKKKSSAVVEDMSSVNSADTLKVKKSSDISSESHKPVSFVSNSQPKLIKVFKFLEDCDLSADIEDADILIRGFLFEFDSSRNVGFLTSGSGLKVEVPRDVMYVMGKKLDTEKDFAEAVAVGSNIKALAKKVFKRVDMESKTEDSIVTYRAVIAWFGEIPNIIDLKPVILQLNNIKESEGQIITTTSQDFSPREIDVDTTEIDSNESTAFEISHINGYMWWANKERGIMRMYETKGWGPTFSGIVFKADALQFEGQKVSCDMLHFLAAHLNKCYVYARRIEPKTIHGMLIKWEAVKVECGHIPQTLMRNVPLQQPMHPVNSLNNGLDPESVQDDSGEKGPHGNVSDLIETPYSVTDGKRVSSNSNYCGKDMNNSKLAVAFGEVEGTGRSPLQQIMMKDVIGDVGNDNYSYSTKNLVVDETPLGLYEKDLSDLFPNEYSGKHLTGRIVKLFPLKIGVGIAIWKSMDYGNVFIIFRQNDMFVDLLPINKMMELPPSVFSRQCNLYVRPIRAQFLFGIKIQMICTCGWLGTKPSCIPTPGEQLMAKISLDNLDTNNSCSDADSPEAQDTSKSSPKESHILVSCKNRVRISDGINANADELNSHLKSKLTLTDKLAHEDVCIAKDDKQVDCYLTGKVIEIHCQMGKLTSEAGTHYFSREQCSLYGVCLSQVELWHVLVHGQKILFTLNKNSKGQSKVEKVIIGLQDYHPGNTSEVEKYIKEWCTNNAVPDCARDILVNQLKKS